MAKAKPAPKSEQVDEEVVSTPSAPEPEPESEPPVEVPHWVVSGG